MNNAMDCFFLLQDTCKCGVCGSGARGLNSEYYTPVMGQHRRHTAQCGWTPEAERAVNSWSTSHSIGCWATLHYKDNVVSLYIVIVVTQILHINGLLLII